MTLAGPRGTVNVDLQVKPEPTSPARLDICRAVATVEGNHRGIPQATIRALADRNVILIEQGGGGKLEAAHSRDLTQGGASAAEAGRGDGPAAAPRRPGLGR